MHRSSRPIRTPIPYPIYDLRRLEGAFLFAFFRLHQLINCSHSILLGLTFVSLREDCKEFHQALQPDGPFISPFHGRLRSLRLAYPTVVGIVHIQDQLVIRFDLDSCHFESFTSTEENGLTPASDENRRLVFRNVVGTFRRLTASGFKSQTVWRF